MDITCQSNVQVTDNRVPFTDYPQAKQDSKQNYAFTVFVPYADTVTAVIDAALEKNDPFACLIPISLISKAPSNEANKTKLKASTKI